MTLLAIIITSAIVAVNVFIYVWKDTKYSRHGIGDTIAYWFVPSLILSALLSIVTLMGVCLVAQITAPKVADKHYVTQLAGLSNTSNINGHFILGCGTIDEQQYIYYNKVKDGCIYTKKVLMDDSSIKVDTTTYLETIVPEYEYIPIFRWMFTSPTYKELRYAKYVFHLKKNEVNMCNYYDISKYLQSRNMARAYPT